MLTVVLLLSTRWKGNARFVMEIARNVSEKFQGSARNVNKIVF